MSSDRRVRRRVALACKCRTPADPPLLLRKDYQDRSIRHNRAGAKPRRFLCFLLFFCLLAPRRHRDFQALQANAADLARKRLRPVGSRLYPVDRNQWRILGPVLLPDHNPAGVRRNVGKELDAQARDFDVIAVPFLYQIDRMATNIARQRHAAGGDEHGQRRRHRRPSRPSTLSRWFHRALHCIRVAFPKSFWLRSRHGSLPVKLTQFASKMRKQADSPETCLCPAPRVQWARITIRSQSCFAELLCFFSPYPPCPRKISSSKNWSKRPSSCLLRTRTTIPSAAPDPRPNSRKIATTSILSSTPTTTKAPTIST